MERKSIQSEINWSDLIGNLTRHRRSLAIRTRCDWLEEREKGRIAGTDEFKLISWYSVSRATPGAWRQLLDILRRLHYPDLGSQPAPRPVETVFSCHSAPKAA